LILPPFIKAGLPLCALYLLWGAVAFGSLEDPSADGSKELSKVVFRTNIRPRSDFTASGFAEATFFPPYNEYPANFGIPFKHEVVARYGAAADVTVEHVPSGLFAGLHLFMPMGDTKPQTAYNYSASPIFLEVRPTLGYRVAPRLDLRLTYNKDFDLGKFASRNEVTPWLALSMRGSTDKPADLWNAAALSGYVETYFFAPGFEYPATPGASPAGYPILNFSRAQIVNARYALELSLRLQLKPKWLDRVFGFADPECFFGDSTLAARARFGGQPLTVSMQYGVGLQLTPNLEFRFYHAEFDTLGGAPAGLLKAFGNGLSLRYVW